jgi:hypothetical protein
MKGLHGDDFVHAQTFHIEAIQPQCHRGQRDANENESEVLEFWGRLIHPIFGGSGLRATMYAFTQSS